MSKHIFWISSYPKSGNTLIRAILTGLLFSDNGIVDFKNMRNISLFETARRLNFIKKINEEDFYNLGNLKVLSKYWQQIQVSQELKEIANQKGYGFLKTHSCLVSLNKNFFTNENLTKGYIYVVRDPRDLSISWANHSNYSIDKSIDFLCNPLSVVRWINKSQFSELPKDIVPMQFLSSWSEHVKSWTENNLQVPKLIIKYEDLIMNKKGIIGQIKIFFKDNYNIEIRNFDQKLQNILKTTNFTFMRDNESKHGFEEAMPGVKFFRKGKKEEWKTVLNKSQISKIENNFKTYMRKFNYL